ncbi:MAG: BPSS1187 family protein [Betaproteobacteria bacterium]
MIPMLFRSALGPAVALLAGCGSGSDAPAPTPAPTPPPASVERDVAPAATDAAITTDLETHFTINPSPASAARGRLFVFFPGTGATPANYRLIVRTAATRGLHSIGLNYPNSLAVASLCNGSADPDCHAKVRNETLLGQDTSQLVTVTPADSIVNRLTKLLAYLHARHPAEGWGQYLTNGQPDWTRIRVAGHSQGGGHAAFIAKQFAVDRAVYFSSPSDWRDGPNQPATWMGSPGATPAVRQYGFTHLRDPLVTITVALGNWQALGLAGFGVPVSVDGAAPPYAGSHQLTTDAAPNPAATTVSPLHGVPVVDAPTPRTASGAPLFEPVWIHLSFS